MDQLDHQKVRVLALAKQLIVSGRQRYICFALVEAAGEDFYLRYAADQMRFYIRRELGKYAYLHSWIENNRPEYALAPGYDPQLARVQWIDWMINQLSEGA